MRIIVVPGAWFGAIRIVICIRVRASGAASPRHWRGPHRCPVGISLPQIGDPINEHNPWIVAEHNLHLKIQAAHHEDYVAKLRAPHCHVVLLAAARHRSYAPTHSRPTEQSLLDHALRLRRDAPSTMCFGNACGQRLLVILMIACACSIEISTPLCTNRSTCNGRYIYLPVGHVMPMIVNI